MSSPDAQFPVHAPRLLRILEISQSGTAGTADTGPVTRTLCALANGFAQRGHAVTIVDPPCAQPRSTLEPSIQVVNVGRSFAHPTRPRRMPGLIGDLTLWLRATAYLRALRRRVQFQDYDAIHVHDTRLASLLALVSPGRYYYTSHSSAWALEREQGKRLGRGRKLEALVERLAARRSRATIGLGEYLGGQLPGARVRTIPNGIDATLWKPTPRPEARAALGLRPDDFVVQFVGRIHPQKGVDVLVEAIRQLVPALPRLRVIAIGSLSGDFHDRSRTSPYSAEVLKRAAGLPIQFAGFIDNKSTAFRNHLSAADVAVFPSRSEPLGYVALEALAMSLPVIASATGGLAHVVSSDVGFLVPPENPARLAAAIRNVHDHPEVLDALRGNCRPRVVNHYTTDQSIARHLALFAEDNL